MRVDRLPRRIVLFTVLTLAGVSGTFRAVRSTALGLPGAADETRLALGGFQAAVARDPALLDDSRWRLLQPAWATATVRARSTAASVTSGITESQRTVLALHKAGASIIAGVDSPLSPFGTALHVELQDFVKAGLTPFEAIKTATINTARLIGVDRDLGTLEPGKLADLVVVDGNPLVDIADTMRVRNVIKNGEVFTIEQLLDVPTARRGQTSAARERQ